MPLYPLDSGRSRRPDACGGPGAALPPLHTAAAAAVDCGRLAVAAAVVGSAASVAVGSAVVSPDADIADAAAVDRRRTVGVDSGDSQEIEDRSVAADFVASATGPCTGWRRWDCGRS